MENALKTFADRLRESEEAYNKRPDNVFRRENDIMLIQNVIQVLKIKQLPQYMLEVIVDDWNMSYSLYYFHDDPLVLSDYAKLLEEHDDYLSIFIIVDWREAYAK